jgi:hypothetical protein
VIFTSTHKVFTGLQGAVVTTITWTFRTNGSLLEELRPRPSSHRHSDNRLLPGGIQA